MKSSLEKKWDAMRDDVDEAIRAGYTAKEFMELNDISRDQWYAMKPPGFKWHKIQAELKIKRRPTINDQYIAPIEPKPRPVQKKDTEKVAIVLCNSSELKNVLNSLLD